MSEESYLDGLLKSMTEPEDVSLSDEELSNLAVNTVKDVEFTDFDISDIDLNDMDLGDIDIPNVSDLFVESSEMDSLMAEQGGEPFSEADMAEPETMAVLDEAPEVPVLDEAMAETESALLDEPESIEGVVPPVRASDDFMDDVDNLLDMLSDTAGSDEGSSQMDEADTLFSLDGLMASDDVFFEAEKVRADEAVPSMEKEEDFFAASDSMAKEEDFFAASDSIADEEASSLEEDLLGMLGEKPEEQQAKKNGIVNKLFANIHDAKSKRAYEKMLSEEEKKALKKKEREEKKAAKKAMKEDPAYIAEQEAKKKAKEEQKAQAKAVKEAKKKEKQELKKQKQAEEEAEAMKDQGRINRVGAGIVFVCLGAFAASIIFGSSSFSYNQSVAKAKECFGNREYTEAYNELCGVNLKSEDVEMYDKVVTVMYVNKQLNSYNNFYAMQMYPEALDSLLKGLEKYDRYQEAAGQLGITDDLDYVREQILVELQNVFALSEGKAYEIINMETQQEYSQGVIEAAQSAN